MINIGNNQIEVILPLCEEDKFFSLCESYAVTAFNKSGEMQPFSMFWTHGRVIVATWDFGNLPAKEMAMAQAKFLCKNLGVTKYFFASEVWMTALRKDDPQYKEKIAKINREGSSKQQDRIERLFLLMETKGERDKSVCYDIVRFDGGKPQLHNRKERNDGIGSGRVAGILNG